MSFFFLDNTFTRAACFCDSPWQNLRAARGPCRGSPQRHGQQLGQTVQSLPGRVERTGALTRRRRPTGNGCRVAAFIQNELLFTDDVVDKGAEAFSGGGMPAGDHCAPGQLPENHRRRSGGVAECASSRAFCLSSLLSLLLVRLMLFVSDPQMSKDIFQYALKAITPKVTISAHAMFSIF